MIIRTVFATVLLAAAGCSDPPPTRPARPDKTPINPAAQVASVCQPGQKDCEKGHDEHGDEGHAKEGEKDHAKGGEKDHDEHGDEGHAKESEKGHAEHGEKGHDEHGEKGHAEHGEKGHAEEGEEGHDEHEEGVVELSPEAAARVDIAVAPVEERDLAGELLTTAEVGFDQDRRVHVAPRAAGRVHEVKVTLGQAVKAGDVLAIIDSTEVGRVKAEYLQARARLGLASETLSRERKLAAEQLSAQREVASARTEVSELRSSLLASTQILRLYGLSDTDIDAIRPGQDDASLVTLVSPLDGKIIERHANRGELVQPDERMFVVADLSQIWISIDLYERDLAKVHLDDIADVKLDAWPDQVFQGRISYLGDVVDAATRTVSARIEVDNTEGKLRPGMFARVRLTDPHIEAPPNRPKSLVIPIGALLRAGEGFITFVKTGERRYERRPLRVIRRTSDFAEIAEGVKAGEPVVVRGGFILKSEAAKESMGGGHSH